MNFIKKNVNNAGDTIVEVLIAITVVSAVLGGAFVTSSRSYNNVRQSQERNEALKAAETQIEQLKSLASSNPAGVFNTPPPYCIDNSQSIRTAFTAGYPKSNIDNDDFSKYPPACKYGARYYLSVQYGAVAQQDFVIQVRWDRLAGGRDEIKINYRVHQ